MLFIFWVDTGSMVEVEVDVALGNVDKLKDVIENKCNINKKKQVLLISGGETLNDDTRVCDYNAGTDTNPIFLFSLINIDNPHPPAAEEALRVEAAREVADELIVSKARESLRLRDDQSAVSVRASIAQEFVRKSEEQIRVCETLILDQHMQHQGWQAVVANLDDTSVVIRKQLDSLKTLAKKYLTLREQHRQTVDLFDDDRAVLDQIPVFSSLLEMETSQSMVGSVIIPDHRAASPGSKATQISLLEWINSRGSSTSLEQLADSCYRAIEQLDKPLFDDVEVQTTKVLENASSMQMKEIKGLSERLQGLEQILQEARQRTQEQKDLAQAFVHNQQRASGLNDASILPDLCLSHREQLKVMTENYHKITGMRKRCTKAKEELSANLHHRMKWVCFIQEQMADKGQIVVMYLEELRRLEGKLGAIEQLHTAPSMYIATVVEVVRRRAFSEHYLQRTATLSEKFSSIHKKEKNLRATFQAKLKKHFLSKMFPGMDDEPPQFATKAPEVFDAHLPNVTIDDVEQLRKTFPDLAKSLQLPEGEALTNYLAKSMINQTLTEEDGETRLQLENMTKKIPLNAEHDIRSVSMMHKFAIGEGRRRASSRHARSFDSDSDEEDNRDNRRTRNGRKYKNKLTKSLPLEDSCLLSLATVQPEKQNNNIMTESTEFTVDKTVDPSCSSADPSSSSNVNSSVAPSSSSDGSVMKNAGSGISQQLGLNESFSPEKIASLSAKLLEVENRYGRLKDSLKEGADVSILKENLSELKKWIVEEKSDFEQAMELLRESISEKTDSLLKESEDSHRRALEELQNETHSEISQLMSQLEVEKGKLEDSNTEIDMYRQQLEQVTIALDKFKDEHADEIEQMKRIVQEQLEEKESHYKEQVQKLMLEHEFELESLKEALNQSDVVQSLKTQVQKMSNALAEKEYLLDDLKKKSRLLESAQENNFQHEKDKIVQILEAGFAQRERLAVQAREEALEKKFEVETQALENKWQQKLDAALKEAEEKAKSDLEAALEDTRKAHEQELKDKEEDLDNELESMLSKEKADWEADKEKQLQALADKLNRKAKVELEGLRTRFKMMQNSGALDRSPSASESEMSVGSPRTELIDSIRSSIAAEYENTLRLEQSRWEKRLEQVQQEHSEALEQLKAKGKVKDKGEQQVKFNELLKKTMEQRDKEIKDLKEKNETLKEQIQQLKMSESIMVSNPAMKHSMSASVIAIDPNAANLEQLQRENLELTRSMHTIINSGKIVSDNLTKGDHVMVHWRPEHNHYAIFNQGPIMHFLHSDSLKELGLEANPGETGLKYLTAEVLDKEFCLAKKSENRFKLPKGTKFYRVKCKALEEQK